MLIFLLVALFCIALVVTLVGLSLSPRPDTQEGVAYAPRAASGVRPRKRTRNVCQNPVVEQPYRPLRQPYVPGGRVGARARAVGTGVAPASVRRVYSGGMAVDDIVGIRGVRLPLWLKLILLSGTIFGL